MVIKGDSTRLAPVVTGNYELGRLLGRVLLQLKPITGNCAVHTVEGGTFDLRGRQGLSEYLADKHWNLLSERCVPENINLMLDQMVEAFPIIQPTLSAIIPLGG